MKVAFLMRISFNLKIVVFTCTTMDSLQVEIRLAGLQSPISTCCFSILLAIESHDVSD